MPLKDLKYTSPKVLSYPKKYKNLSLNLDVEDLVVNIVLVKKENIIQCMVYYFSNIFQDAKTRYLKVEKKAFALVNAFRKLKSYFLAHQIIILIDKPLWHILYKPIISGLLIRWEIKLGEFGFQYKLKSTIKGQALIDFIVECFF